MLLIMSGRIDNLRDCENQENSEENESLDAHDNDSNVQPIVSDKFSKNARF